MNQMTKGEALVAGLEQVQEGLRTIAGVGKPDYLFEVLVGSKRASQQLREAMGTKSIFRAMILAMVKSRHTRLAADTVEGVIDSFLEVLTDLRS